MNAQGGAALRLVELRESFDDRALRVVTSIESGRLQQQLSELRATASSTERSKDLRGWASAQYRLANALLLGGLREGEGSVLTKEATSAYKAALSGFEGLGDERNCALTLGNWGMALLVAGEPAGAVDALRAARTRFKKADDPREWARIRTNLASGLQQVARTVAGREEIDEAIGAVHEALEVCTFDEDPMGWAMAQEVLADTVSVLSERTGETALLVESATSLRNALRVYDPEGFPLEWANAQSKLGNRLLIIGDRQEEKAAHQRFWEESAEALRAALTVLSEEDEPALWAETQSSLGSTLLRLGGACRLPVLDEAHACMEAALRVFKPADHPKEWAHCQRNIEAWAKIQEMDLSATEFDKRSFSVASRGGATREEAIAEDEPSETRRKKLRDDFAEASIGDLVEAFVPAVPQAAMDRLEVLIRAAQATPPEDQARFVAQVNRLMTAQSLRLQVEGEEGLARLTMKEGLIRLAVAGRGQQRFRGREIRVVRVPEDYGLKSRKPSASPSPTES